MSTTELPTLCQPRIAEGTFVVFSFDPRAYAASLDPEDEILSKAASEIERKKYLGLIEGVGPVDLPRLRQNPDIRVVGRAPPQEGEDDVYFTSPKRCIPVHPNTDHPEGRAPLVPSAPLPWPDCYVHTLQLVNAFVSRVHHSNPTNARITNEELRRVSDSVVDDQYGAAADGRAAKAGNGRGREAHSELSYYSEDSEEEEDGSSSASSVDEDISAPVEVYIEIWEDLAVAKTLGEPKDVGADIDEIVQIGEEWASRKKKGLRANAVETSKWAAHVAESGFLDHPTHEDAAFADAQLHNSEPVDELAPEDAIGERAGSNAHREEGPAPPSSILAVDVYASAAINDAVEEAHAAEEDRRSETTGASHAHLVREEGQAKATVASRVKGWFQQMFCF